VRLSAERLAKRRERLAPGLKGSRAVRAMSGVAWRESERKAELAEPSGFHRPLKQFNRLRQCVRKSQPIGSDGSR